MNIDNVEERKIHEHFNFVTNKLEKLHKSLMWNLFIGTYYVHAVKVYTVYTYRTVVPG